MKKIYLLKYESPKFIALKDWIDYKLHLEIVWFGGLFKQRKISEYRIHDHEDSKAHFEHWDKLITDKLPLT
jgi:hypothetical protein